MPDPTNPPVDLTGYTAAAAALLVRAIDGALAGWQRTDSGPGLWTWRREGTDDAPARVVCVNALPDRILVPSHVWPRRVGPTLLAGEEGDAFVSVTLPHISSAADIGKALQIAAAFVPEFR